MTAKQPSKTPEEIRAINDNHAQNQAKKVTLKKKAGRYTRAECEVELERLAKASHEGSKYFRDVVGRQQQCCKSAWFAAAGA